MSLYPTLEDLKIEEIFTAQEQEDLRRESSFSSSTTGDHKQVTKQTNDVYCGVPVRHYLDSDGHIIFSEPSSEPQTISVPAAHLPPAHVVDHTSITTPAGPVTVPESTPVKSTDGVRKLTLKKNSKGKIGIQCRCIDNGCFVSFVQAESSAAQMGLRFGDQILEFNGEYVSGKKESQISKMIKDAPSNSIEVIIRERPIDRRVTLVKDSHGKVGFVVKKGCIEELVKDSSAARNGVLINQQLIELNGTNVIGLDDKTISTLIDAIPERVTITTMPKPMFQVLVKKLGSSQLKREMDRSQPDY